MGNILKYENWKFKKEKYINQISLSFSSYSQYQPIVWSYLKLDN